MKVLLVTQYFPPEIGAPQARLSEMARAWAARGDEVTVLTGMPNHPTGSIQEGYRGRRRMVEEVDGYRVVRTWLYATPNEGIVKKTLSHLSFMVSSVLLGGRKAGRPDVVVVSSPTFFSIFSAWLLARIRRAPLVVEVRDLWPGIFIDLGVLTNHHLIWLLERLELAAYASAAHVVVVTEGFRQDLVQRGVPPEKVSTITNGVDLERFRPVPGDDSDREWLGAEPGELLALYIGAHGISQGLATLIRAAEHLDGHKVHVALVGQGADKVHLLRLADELGVGNVSFHDAVPRDRVLALVAAADVCLVSLRDVPLFTTFIPSKMFECLAAGKPVIGALRGEAAGILVEAGAVVVEPESAEQLADALVRLADDPALMAEMGSRGPEFVAEHYDRGRLAERYRSILQELTA